MGSFVLLTPDSLLYSINNLDILETSLGDFTWSAENREIFSAEIG